MVIAPQDTSRNVLNTDENDEPFLYIKVTQYDLINMDHLIKLELSTREMLPSLVCLRLLTL